MKQLFSVVQARSKQVGKGLAKEQTMGVRWFGSLEDAEVYFRNLPLARPINTNDERGFIKIWDTKYLYHSALGDKADQLTETPPDDAVPLPSGVRFDPRAGTLIEQEARQTMGLVDRFWSVLRDAGYTVLNYRKGPAAPLAEWMIALEFPGHSQPLPFVPAYSQTVRIVRKKNSWFFVYVHESSTEHGSWGFSDKVFNQIGGQGIIPWVMVFLKERETEGFWAEPHNVSERLVRKDWTFDANGNYLLNYPRGVSGCMRFHDRSEMLRMVDDFAQRSLVPT
jgi:hypothetical protein